MKPLVTFDCLELGTDVSIVSDILKVAVTADAVHIFITKNQSNVVNS